MQYTAIKLAPGGEPAQVITGKDRVMEAIADFLLNGDHAALTLVRVPEGRRLTVACREKRAVISIQASRDVPLDGGA